jgi:hypothetical protein
LVVGRYLVRECVGAGPLGIVYRAEDLVLREDVALRIVWPDLVPDDGARLGFLRGATAARALASRYVGAVRDAFIDEVDRQSACVVAGDFLRRPTLAARLARRMRYDAPYAPVEVTPILSQIAAGLAAVHRAGLLHGNLKARNVFFAGEEVRIGDLGVAAALPIAVVRAAQGAPPPDRPQDRRGVADDVHALATLTAEMLGLRPATKAQEGPETPPPEVTARRGGAPPPGEEIPAAVRAALDRALSPQTRERFPDVDAFAAALLPALQGGPGRAGRRTSTPAGPPGAARGSKGEDSAFITGALVVSPATPTPRPAAVPPPAGPSVLVDPDALKHARAAAPTTASPADAPTPPPLAVSSRDRPTPPLAPLERDAATPPVVRLPAVPRRRPRWVVPNSLVITLVAATAALALGLLHRIIDAHFEEQTAIARVENARVRARLRAATAAATPTAVAAAAPAAAVARPRCSVELREVPGTRSCIAAFEYPGARAVPRVGVTLDQARTLCGQRGQRLCRRDEWQAACSGAAGSAFPYGRVALKDHCNTAGADEDPGLMPSGSYRLCRTPAGVYDMTGNAAEWVDDGMVMGGDLHTRPVQARCGVLRPSGRARRGTLVGFRCCADAGP